MIYLRKFDANYLQILTEDDGILQEIEARYTFKHKQFVRDKFSKKSQLKTFRINLVEDRTLLPLGLVHDLIEYFDKMEYDYELEKKLISTPHDSLNLAGLIEKERELNMPFSLRPYQRNAVIKAYNKQRAIIVSSTSSGKTAIVYALCMLFLEYCSPKKKILIIVPRTSLVEQLYYDFKEYSKDSRMDLMPHVKMIYSEYDKIIEDYHHIVVSTWQSLNNFKDQSFFKNVRYLFVDEVHNSADDRNQSISVKRIIQIVMSCENTKYRIGLTGTVWSDNVKEEVLQRKTLEGLFGRVCKVSNPSMLIENKYVSDVNISVVVFNYGIKKEKVIPNYAKEVEYVNGQMEKLKYLRREILDNTENNVIILYKHIDYGKMVQEYLIEHFPDRKVWLVNGMTPALERMRIQSLCEKTEKNIIVGSYATFGEGINIKNLHKVIFMEDIKSRFKVIQGIGRGMRLHASKAMCDVYDFVDKLYVQKGTIKKIGYLYKHFIKRKRYYEQEGYKYRIKDIVEVKSLF